MVTTQQMVEFSEKLASDLIQIGKASGMPAKELLMSLVMTERLLQKTLLCCPDHAREAVLEGHATFDAVSMVLTSN